MSILAGTGHVTCDNIYEVNLPNGHLSQPQRYDFRNQSIFARGIQFGLICEATRFSRPLWWLLLPAADKLSVAPSHSLLSRGCAQPIR